MFSIAEESGQISLRSNSLQKGESEYPRLHSKLASKLNLTIFSSMLAFFVVIRVTDSEGAYCDSNDLSCGGILPGIMITVTANNSAPIFENSCCETR